jgi:hypothetical protein
MIFRREPGYLDNPMRQNMWRAGHAHAGVLRPARGRVSLSVGTVILGLGLLSA